MMATEHTTVQNVVGHSQTHIPAPNTGEPTSGIVGKSKGTRSWTLKIPLQMMSTPRMKIVEPQRYLQDYNYLTGEEIKDLCTSCRMVNYTSEVRQSFIIFSAQKP